MRILNPKLVISLTSNKPYCLTYDVLFKHAKVNRNGSKYQLKSIKVYYHQKYTEYYYI